MQYREVTLYDIERENGERFLLSARIVGGALLLDGQDFTALAADMFGDEEYE